MAMALPPTVDASYAPFVASNAADRIVDQKFEVLNHDGARKSKHFGAQRLTMDDLPDDERGARHLILNS